MGLCNISSKELAEALEIGLERLMEICDFFDEFPDDCWELSEGEHFEWGIRKTRFFSSEGAVEICRYLEENQQERPFFKRLQRWILRRDRRLKGLMVSKRVQEASQLRGQLVFRNNKAFLGPRACREVLGLGRRQDVLNRTFKEIIRSPENIEKSLIKIDIDFFESPDESRYFSRSGLASIGKQLGTTLTKKHRQEWAKIVEEFAPKALEAIEKHEANREKRIKKAMDRVRRHANGRCQLTNRRCNVENIDLEVHHLFDKKTHPDLADIEDNLIAIGNDLHRHFHQWMGGTQVPCTVEDMEKYVDEFSYTLFPGDNPEPAMKAQMLLARAKRLR